METSSVALDSDASPSFVVVVVLGRRESVSSFLSSSRAILSESERSETLLLSSLKDTKLCGIL